MARTRERSRWSMSRLKYSPEPAQPCMKSRSRGPVPRTWYERPIPSSVRALGIVTPSQRPPIMAKCPLGVSRLPRLERLGGRFLWKQRATLGEGRRERILSQSAAYRCELLGVGGLLLEGAGRPDRL